MVLRAFKGAFDLNAAIGKSLHYLIRVGEEFAGTVISESTIYCSLLSISISIGAARFDPAYPAMVHIPFTFYILIILTDSSEKSTVSLL